MGSEIAARADVICAQNIAFLHLLHKVPHPPTTNRANSLIISTGNYVLPFDRECGFVDACAFLAGIRTAPDRIPAVCVRQTPAKDSLELLIAVNKNAPRDGTPFCGDMKAGFEEVFMKLRQFGTASSQDIQAQVLDAIISMCSMRIRERLGMDGIATRPYGKVRKPVCGTLRKVVDHIWSGQHQEGPSRASETQTFVTEAKSVIKTIDAWSNHRVLADLKAVVEAVHKLSQVAQWRNVVDSIPDNKMDSTERDKLVRVIDKIAKYQDVARYLYRTAKKFPIARNVGAVMVDLPASSFETTPPKKYTPELDSVFQKVRTKKLPLSKIYPLLNKAEAEARSEFRETAQSIMTRSRIHAEVQLLWYCDQSSKSPRPRVICSTKKACFLCNLLIKVHGKMHTPSSHGRLYTPWRLPTSWNGELSRRFNIALEHFSRGSLSTMGQSRRAINYPDPCESATASIALSSTTLAGPVLAAIDEGEEDDPTTSQVVDGVACTPGDGIVTVLDETAACQEPRSLSTPEIRVIPESPVTSNQPITSTQHTQEDIETKTLTPDVACQTANDRLTPTDERGSQIQGADIAMPGPPVPTSSGTSADGLERRAHVLRPGCTISTQVPSSKLKPSRLITTEKFDLLIDRATGDSVSLGAHGISKNLVCEISCLDAEEAHRVREGTDRRVVFDVDTLDEISLPRSECVGSKFYLARGGFMLEVTLRDAGI